MNGTRKLVLIGMVIALLMSLGTAQTVAEDWLQLKYDCRHSGDVPDRALKLPLGLLGAVPLTDAVLTAPVVADGRVYAVDASGVAFCIDAESLEVVWKVATPGGPGNCNNVSSPALIDAYLHFGTMAGSYFVLRAADGSVVKEIRCGEPIFSAPVVGNGRAYFATLGSRVYAVEPDGTVAWCWDFVREVMGFDGDPSIVPPILLRGQAVFGGLDGRLYVVPLSGREKAWSFATAFGNPISAPACVCDGRVYFGCEDGYLYALGPGGDCPLPSKDLEVWKIRHRLSSKLAGAEHDWSTNFGDLVPAYGEKCGLASRT